MLFELGFAISNVYDFSFCLLPDIKSLGSRSNSLLIYCPYKNVKSLYHSLPPKYHSTVTVNA